jgi:hypothetical protein
MLKLLINLQTQKIVSGLYYVKTEFIMAVTIKDALFWDVTMCSLVET